MDANSKTGTQSLKILFWNARSILQRSPEIQDMLKKVDILICVESWLKAEDNIHQAGFLT